MTYMLNLVVHFRSLLYFLMSLIRDTLVRTFAILCENLNFNFRVIVSLASLFLSKVT